MGLSGSPSHYYISTLAALLCGLGWAARVAAAGELIIRRCHILSPKRRTVAKHQARTMFNIYKVYKLAAVYKCLEIVKGSGKLNFVMQSQFVSLFINCKAALPIRDCQSRTLPISGTFPQILDSGWM